MILTIPLELIQTPELRTTALAAAELSLWQQVQDAAMELDHLGCPIYACAFLPVNDKAMELPYAESVTTATMEIVRRQKVNLPVQLMSRYYESHQPPDGELTQEQLPKLPPVRTKGGELQKKLRLILKRLCNRDLGTNFTDRSRAAWGSLNARLNLSWPAELGTHQWYETHNMRLGLLHWFFENEHLLKMSNFPMQNSSSVP